MFDLIFVIGSFIFILVAFFRGFVKELFALLNWIITLSLSYLLSPYAAKFVGYYSHNKLVINVASGSIVFVIIFIGVFFATRGLARDWKEKMPENADRILGIIYGFFKALLIFGLFYAITINFYASLLGDIDKPSKNSKVDAREKNLPDWLTQSKSFPIIRFSGKIVDPLVRSGINGATDKLLEDVKPKRLDLDDKIDSIIDDEENGLGDEVGGSAGALLDKKSGKGYSKKEIEKMNRLIEIVN